jgi:hypothetical protein
MAVQAEAPFVMTGTAVREPAPRFIRVREEEVPRVGERLDILPEVAFRTRLLIDMTPRAVRRIRPHGVQAVGEEEIPAMAGWRTPREDWQIRKVFSFVAVRAPVPRNREKPPGVRIHVARRAIDFVVHGVEIVGEGGSRFRNGRENKREGTEQSSDDAEIASSGHRPALPFFPSSGMPKLQVTPQSNRSA